MLGNHHIDALILSDLDFLTDNIGMNWELASTAINQYRQRDGRRPSEVRQLVECGTDCPAGIQHVVHGHDVLALKVPRQMGGPDDRSRADGLRVVSIESDVQRALR